MLAPFKAALSVIIVPLILLAAGFWAGASYQAGRGLAAENAALIDQARMVEDMLQDAARRAVQRRETLETFKKELAEYEAGLDGACRLDDADLERLRGF